MEKIIIEVGSTVTKVDLYDGQKVTRLENVTIFFKKHFKELGKIADDDYDKLCNTIKKLQIKYKDIYVCGTSIFRDLPKEQKEEFLARFTKDTSLDFSIISQDDESRLTCIGAAQKSKSKVAIMIGGGGSTEIAIYDKKVIDNQNTSLGVMDVLEAFPDLKGDIAKSSLEQVMTYIKERLNIPSAKADILILAGGAHELFARVSGFNYENNKLYDDIASPIMMDIKTRINDTKKFFEEVSLDAIKEKSNDPAWWDATRAMCAFALVVAQKLEVKYIVPTDISMVYGIIAENANKKVH